VLTIVSLVFLQATTDPLTLERRVQFIENALQIIVKYPLFGVGLGNYLLAQQQFPERFADLLNQPVHNIYLLLLSEVGIVITVVLGFIFRQKFKSAFKNSAYIFLVVILTGSFDHYWLTLQQNFLLIGVILGAL